MKQGMKAQHLYSFFIMSWVLILSRTWDPWVYPNCLFPSWICHSFCNITDHVAAEDALPLCASGSAFPPEHPSWSDCIVSRGTGTVHSLHSSSERGRNKDTNGNGNGNSNGNKNRFSCGRRKHRMQLQLLRQQDWAQEIQNPKKLFGNLKHSLSFHIKKCSV